MSKLSVSQFALVPAVVTMLLTGLPAQAATSSAQPSTASQAARAKYARDTAHCRTLPVQSTARANCLSEASTAFAQTQPDKPEEAPSLLAQNALRRCDALPAPDKQDCVKRMQIGSTSGNVASGGILRELVTREVIIDPAALPPTAAGPAASGVAAPPVAPMPAPQPVAPTPVPSPQPVAPVPPAPPVEQVPPAGYPPPPMRPTPP